MSVFLLKVSNNNNNNTNANNANTNDTYNTNNTTTTNNNIIIIIIINIIIILLLLLLLCKMIFAIKYHSKHCYINNETISHSFALKKTKMYIQICFKTTG